MERDNQACHWSHGTCGQLSGVDPKTPASILSSPFFLHFPWFRPMSGIHLGSLHGIILWQGFSMETKMVAKRDPLLTAYCVNVKGEREEQLSLARQYSQEGM